MKETLNFQTETSELLNLMIHSIYTHKEIFLRELISNASDAIDKLKYLYIEDNSLLEGDSEFYIDVFLDREAGTIRIVDNGIGMDHDDLLNHLGTVAKSGSKAFMRAMEEAEKVNNIDVIGQFGVGFYSAFMIADRITVATRKAGTDRGYLWESTGESTFTVDEVEKKGRGTEITLHLREDEDGENREYLQEYKVRELVKKYSDYVRYPIRLEVEKKEEETTVKEMETLNSMVPIWKKNRTEVTEEEYKDFYTSKYHDWEEPLKHIHFKVEGNIEYTALLYIPSKAPMDFYTREFEKGLQLYTKNVFIMDKCKELLPDHFRFIRGLVDSSDFSLNISREILQQDRQLQVIAKNLAKKIQRELEGMLKTDRETYEKFWKEFGVNIKAGIYESYGVNKENLKNLLIFPSTMEEGMVTLKEYVDRMPEEQKDIYYLAGEDIESLKRMPQLEAIKDKGFEVLLLNERVDEFAVKTLDSYEEKQFKSITEVNLDLETEEEKKELEDAKEANRDLLEEIKDSLGERITDVRLTNRLKSSAVCLVSGENGISFEMEKAFKDMPGGNPAMKAERILEINPGHDLFKALKNVHEAGEEVGDYADILYNQALLVEGFALEDPIEFSNKITKLLIKAAK
ncbi:chaperone protein HtpG [Propionigenium maris DSM 9537]|uniref:Chaperone protein HtpG n=1 Tax=Propionigenium maris DSM 9537 TaxID=1123000 RepID=A0A9W6GNM1_9FUSO|nr:molecular chaperone HtpG [Propionigenium maris]GLI56976.1 chaperone protein HtpG [Propionigenium maris DSM 9537]